MDVRGPRVTQGDFEPGFRSRFHSKNLNIFIETVQRLAVPVPAAGLAHERFAALMAAGCDDLDHSTVITILEDLAHVEARTRGEKL